MDALSITLDRTITKSTMIKKGGAPFGATRREFILRRKFLSPIFEFIAFLL
jgi:hypothetical protein